ncbi:MAG: SDR family oxidoreductase [Pseudomonadota bacterium]
MTINTPRPDRYSPLPAQPERSLARRVLVIGGAGYIGGAVGPHLLEKGFGVRDLDLLVYGHDTGILPKLQNPGYSFIFGDMGDPATLAEALDGATDVVILAGLVGDPITRSYPEAARTINDEALKRCIDMLNGRGLDRVIFVSTCSNYGMIGEDETADETFALNPLSLYAEAKVRCEQHLLSLRGAVDYKPVVLRFATAFGLAPRMRFDLTVNEFTRDLFLDKALEVYDAHTWRPYCHVRDFARLIETVLLAPAESVAFDVFNAGSNANNYTKQGLVDLIQDFLPGRTIAYRENSSDPRNYRVNFSKLNTVLGFECRTSVRDGVQEILWALQNRLLDGVDARRTFHGNYELARVTARAAEESEPCPTIA